MGQGCEEKVFFCEKVINGDGGDYSNVLIRISREGYFTEFTPDVLESNLSLSYEKLQGIICPGFVNAHCHLELSCLKDQIKPKLGLTKFLAQVGQMRHTFDREETEAKMQYFDTHMYQNGIVAVGDICNTDAGLKIKKNSPVEYHNFIELIGFEESRAESVFQKGIELSQSFSDTSFSFSAHAPYSVSDKLVDSVLNFNVKLGQPFSIHNQEAEAENMFFQDKTGDFVGFLNAMNIDIEHFEPIKKNSVFKYSDKLPENINCLLVHNTFTSEEDLIQFKEKQNVFFVFCPQANLYIENHLPDYTLFSAFKDRICVGTDSLASNTDLCVFSELKTLQQASNFTLNDLIRFGTLNGAKALGLEQKIGTIAVGKKAFLNQIFVDEKETLSHFQPILF